MAPAILESAEQLVERGWCQGAAARNEAGVPVAPTHERACSWSLLGAIVAAAGGADMLADDPATLEQVAKASLAVGLATGEDSLLEWNDEAARTADEVIAAFEAALTILERFPGRPQ